MRRFAGLGLIVILLLAGAACNSGVGQASLQQAVDKAITKTSEALSYRSSGNATWQEDNLVCSESSEFEYSGPESWHGFDTDTCDGDGSAYSTWTEVVVAGGAAYMRSSSHPEWQVAEPYVPPPWPSASQPSMTPGTAAPRMTPTATPTPAPLLPLPPPGAQGKASPIAVSTGNTLDGLPPGTPEGSASPTPIQAPSTGNSSLAVETLDKEWAPFRYLVDLERLPDEQIDGVTCSHYQGRVDQDAYVDMLTQRQEDLYGEVAESMSEGLELTRRQSHEVELWIDEDDYVRQRTISVRFPKPDYSTGEETWVAGSSTTRYYDFNEVIIIEPPEIEAE